MEIRNLLPKNLTNQIHFDELKLILTSDQLTTTYLLDTTFSDFIEAEKAKKSIENKFKDFKATIESKSTDPENPFSDEIHSIRIINKPFSSTEAEQLLDVIRTLMKSDPAKFKRYPFNLGESSLRDLLRKELMTENKAYFTDSFKGVAWVRSRAKGTTYYQEFKSMKLELEEKLINHDLDNELSHKSSRPLSYSGIQNFPNDKTKNGQEISGTKSKMDKQTPISRIGLVISLILLTSLVICLYLIALGNRYMIIDNPFILDKWTKTIYLMNDNNVKNLKGYKIIKWQDLNNKK